MLRLIERIKWAISWFWHLGFRATVTWTLYRAKGALGFPPPSTLTIKPRQARFPLTVRLGGSSDLDVFKQMFLWDEYACLRDIPSPRLVLDLGANVGCSSAYLLSCFPKATVVSVEPDPGNFEQCRKNLAPYGERSKVILGAVWSKRCKLVLSRGSFGDGREWATQVRESTGQDKDASVDAWDIPSLMQLGGEQQVDLLKVDIERSELEVFGATSSSWLPKVRNICIELHGEDCKRTFLGALRDFEFERQHSGELTICRNLSKAASREAAGGNG